MPISVNQIPVALTTIGQLTNTLSSISSLLNEAQILSNQNWVVALSPGVSITISSDQQTAMMAQYDSLKAQLAVEYGTLP